MGVIQSSELYGVRVQASTCLKSFDNAALQMTLACIYLTLYPLDTLVII